MSEDLYRIERFVVTQPPTFEGVLALARTAMSDNGKMTITCLPQRDIPRPEPLQVAVELDEHTNPDSRSIRIHGLTEDQRSINIENIEGDTEPASATIVMPGYF